MLKTTFAAICLMAMPGLAFAYGCNSDKMHDTTASMSCADGTELNSETGICVPVVTG